MWTKWGGAECEDLENTKRNCRLTVASGSGCTKRKVCLAAGVEVWQAKTEARWHHLDARSEIDRDREERLRNSSERDATEETKKRKK